MAQLPSIELNCPPDSRCMRDLSIQPIALIPGLNYAPDHPVVWEGVSCRPESRPQNMRTVKLQDNRLSCVFWVCLVY